MVPLRHFNAVREWAADALDWVAVKPGVSVGFSWEPVLIYGGRRRHRHATILADAIYTPPVFEKFSGKSIGIKPYPYCAWIFEALGCRAGDTLTDLFPGQRCSQSRVGALGWRTVATDLPTARQRPDGGRMTSVYVICDMYSGEDPLAFAEEADAKAYAEARGLMYDEVQVVAGPGAQKLIEEAQNDA